MTILGPPELAVLWLRERGREADEEAETKEDPGARPSTREEGGSAKPTMRLGASTSSTRKRWNPCIPLACMQNLLIDHEKSSTKGTDLSYKHEQSQHDFLSVMMRARRNS